MVYVTELLVEHVVRSQLSAVSGGSPASVDICPPTVGDFRTYVVLRHGKQKNIFTNGFRSYILCLYRNIINTII